MTEVGLHAIIMGNIGPLFITFFCTPEKCSLLVQKFLIKCTVDYITI